MCASVYNRCPSGAPAEDNTHATPLSSRSTSLRQLIGCSIMFYHIRLSCLSVQAYNDRAHHFYSKLLLFFNGRVAPPTISPLKLKELHLANDSRPNYSGAGVVGIRLPGPSELRPKILSYHLRTIRTLHREHHISRSAFPTVSV